MRIYRYIYISINGLIIYICIDFICKRVFVFIHRTMHVYIYVYNIYYYISFTIIYPLARAKQRNVDKFIVS